ncbi:Uncharacterized protein APZ42_024761 [Daphnia magna]|uniref:Uncharacterized protein n=1 Tax=Daphnia magna TaxID=35525 RepID=A0A164TSE5_9CRUS|nr:Uncharacterized protein APZ42_024761 [Daphnia magna]
MLPPSSLCVCGLIGNHQKGGSVKRSIITQHDDPASVISFSKRNVSTSAVVIAASFF